MISPFVPMSRNRLFSAIAGAWPPAQPPLPPVADRDPASCCFKPRRVILALATSWLLQAMPMVAVAAPEHLQNLIYKVAREERMDPALLEAVMCAESAYNSTAVSPKGAMGLMQLMPGTARQMQVGNPFDPEENLRGGARYLRGLMLEFSDLSLALAAYNAGPEHVKNYGGIPPFPETRNYVSKILQRYKYPWMADKLHLVNPRLVISTPSKPIFRYRSANGTLVLTDIPPKYRGDTKTSTPVRVSRTIVPKPSKLSTKEMRRDPKITIWRDGKAVEVQVKNDTNRLIVLSR